MIDCRTTVGVTTWDSEHTVCQCLQSIELLGGLETIVCDCGSTDRTLSFVADKFPEVRIVELDRDSSLSESRNHILQLTQTPYVLFVDGDWMVDRAGLTRLQDQIQQDKNLAFVVPQFRNQDGSLQLGHNVRRFPTGLALCAEFLVLHKLFGHDPWTRRYRMEDFDHQEDRLVDHGCGAVILARRDILLSLGGYDEKLRPAWVEDVEISRRLQSSGYSTKFCAGSTALHLGRETLRHRLIEARYDSFYRSVLHYARQHLRASFFMIRTALALGLTGKLLFSYGLPASVRVRILRARRIYNEDSTIQGYRHLYLKALKAAVRGK